MNKTNNTYSTGMDTPKRATQAEIPAAIEVLQKQAARLSEEISILIGRLSPVTGPEGPMVAGEAVKSQTRHGLLQPLDELTVSIEISASVLQDLRSRLMI